MTTLNAHRSESTRFVGGCVRNALLGSVVSDIDIATQIQPDEVCRVLEDAGVTVHKTGFEHGTITAVTAGSSFEITTLRKDVSTDGRRATVSFTDDWLEDASRRDFRLNALYAEANGRVLDPLKHGLDDLRDRRIVFIGEPRERIAEDYLRIMRFFRFYASYGRGEPDQAGLLACSEGSEGLFQISAERIWVELKKMMSASDPRRAMEAMAQTGVLEVVLPDNWGLTLFNQVVGTDLAHQLKPDPIVRLMALHSKDPDLMERLANDLRMSNAERRRLIAVSEDQTVMAREMSEHEFRVSLYRLGEQTMRDRARLTWAARPDIASDSYWMNFLTAIDRWKRPAFPICGEDVVALGVKPGPQIGDILRELESWWVDNDFPDDVSVVARQLRNLVSSRRLSGAA